MGLLREDGSPKPALKEFERHAPEMGLVQWFHFEDPRLDEAVDWMKRLGVTHLRTGLSWADSFRPGALDWFDRQMEALADFRRRGDLLLHAGALRRDAAPHQPAAGKQCIEECLRCYSICLSTAMKHCLELAASTWRSRIWP